MKKTIYILLLMFTIILTCVSVSVNGAWVPSDYAHYYPFESSGEDIIGDGVSFSLTGAIYDNGYIGKGISCDGVDDSASFDGFELPSNDWSMTFSMNPNTVTNGVVLGENGGTNSYRLSATNSDIDFYFWDTSNNFVNVYTALDDVPINEWSTVTVTYNDTTYNIKLYVDGEYKDNATLTTNVRTSVADVNYFCRRDHATPLWWNGSIDNFVVHARMLDDTEIVNLYDKFFEYHNSSNVFNMTFGEVEGSTSQSYLNLIEGTTGILDGGIKFDRASESRISGITTESTGGELTFSTWVKFRVSASDSMLLDYQESYLNNMIWFRANDNKLQVLLWNKTGTLSGYYQTNITTNPVPIGDWFHYTVTINSSGMRMYIDGSEIVPTKTTDLNFDFGDTAHSFTLGNSNDTGQAGDIDMDEVVLINRTLTPTEISNLYQSGNPTQKANEIITEDIVYYSAMNELYDFSGYNNHGTTYGDMSYNVLDGAFNFNGVNQHIATSAVDTSENFSYYFVANLTQVSGNGAIVDNREPTGDLRGFQMVWRSDNLLRPVVDTGLNFTYFDYDIDTLDTWYKIAFVQNKNNSKLYINGVLTNESEQSGILYEDHSAPFYIGSRNFLFEGSISDVSVFNYSLSDNQILELSGTESFINITFDKQEPIDVIFDQILGKTINVSYNITSTYPLTNITFYGEHSPNGGCDVFINGECVETNYYNYTDVIGDTYTWRFEDINLLPTLFQTSPETYDTYEQQTFNLDTISESIKLKFLNYSLTKNITLLGVMANTSESAPLVVYYCNESYTTGNPTTNEFCSLGGELGATTGYEHIHNENSSHNTISIPNDNGFVGDTKITSVSYLIFKSVGDWEFKYIEYTPEVGITQSSINNGVSWSDLTWQFNVHIHQLYDNQAINYNVTATDNKGYSFTSPTRLELLDIGGFPPSSVEILSPRVFTLPVVNTINYTESISPHGYDVGSYAISIFDANFDLIEVIKDNNSDSLSYFYDFGSIPYGLYYLQVNATDSLGLSSTSYSPELLTVGTTTTTTTQFVVTTTLLPIDTSGTTHQFQSTEQGLFYMMLMGMWIIFYYMTFNLKGETGGTVGFMNILQMIVAISIGLSFGRFNWLIGYGIMLVGVGTFVGKVMYGKT